MPPRLKTLSMDEADPSVRPDFDAFLKARGNVPNLFATLARRPGVMRAAAALLREVLAPGEVPVRVKELVALRVSWLNGCDYCGASHRKLALAAGATDADLAAVEERACRSLAEPERAAIHYADAMSAVGGRVPADVYAELRRHWSETAVVELTAVAGAFAMFNRLAIALEVEVTR
jgi:uncharacterized peroxidase-related enzyme